MPTQPSDILMNKIKDQNRFRDQMVAKGAVGSVASLAAGGTGGGFGAGYGLGQQMYKPKAATGFTAQQAVGAKTKLLDDMSDLQDKVGKGKIGLAEALAKQNDNFKTTLGYLATSRGNADSANASVASSFNSGLTSLTNEQVKAIMTQLTQTVPDPQGLRRGLEDMQALMANGNMTDPAIAAKFQDLMNKEILVAGPNGGATAAAIAQAVELTMAQTAGSEDNPNPFRSYLESMAQNGDTNAKQALSTIESVSSDYAKITQMGVDKAKDMAVASLGAMKTGVASSDKDIAKDIEILQAMGISPTSPQDVSKLIDASMSAGPQNGGASPEAYKKLLDQIDSDTVDPASTLGEARRRLFASDEFQQWKKQNGFQDDGMALKELRRLTTEKIHSNRQQDRTLMGQRQQQDVGPGTGPPMSAAARMSSEPAQPKMAPAGGGQSRMVTAPDHPYGFVIVSPDGTMRDPTDAETNPGGHIYEMMKEDINAFSAMLRPVSEYEALKKQKQESDQANSKTLIDDATKQAMELGGDRPTATVSSAANEAGFMATHPGQLEGTVESALLKRMRKKKTDQAVADNAGIFATPE